MRRVASLLLAVMITAAAAFGMSACSSEQKTIEDYLSESPSAQQDIEESLGGLANSDMDVDVTYDQNRIVITCSMKTTYKKTVLKSIKKSYKKYMKDNLTEPMENAVMNIERETGLSGVTIQVVVNNGDGKEIWSQIYPIGAEEETEATAEETEASGDSQDETGSAQEETTGDAESATEEK